jgi:hypothetical protein
MTATVAAQTPFPTRGALRGIGWRVGVSILSVFGFASFLLLYFAFWAGSFSAAQDLAVVLVAILVFIAANGAAWASWGIRQAPGPDAPDRW